MRGGRRKPFNGLELHEDTRADDEVEPVTTLDERAFIRYRDWPLALEPAATFRELGARQASYADSNNPGPRQRCTSIIAPITSADPSSNLPTFRPSCSISDVVHPRPKVLRRWREDSCIEERHRSPLFRAGAAPCVGAFLSLLGALAIPRPAQASESSSVSSPSSASGPFCFPSFGSVRVRTSSRIALSTQNASQAAAAESDLMRELLTRLIDDRLEEGAARAKRTSRSPTKEIDSGLRQVASQNGIDPKVLVAEAKRQGLTERTPETRFAGRCSKAN